MTKLLPYILFEKCIYILALEMAIPGNHCAREALCQLYRHTFSAAVKLGYSNQLCVFDKSTDFSTEVEQYIMNKSGCSAIGQLPPGGRVHPNLFIIYCSTSVPVGGVAQRYRTSVSGRQTFPVLRSTCNRPTQPFILSGSIK